MPINGLRSQIVSCNSAILQHQENLSILEPAHKKLNNWRENAFLKHANDVIKHEQMVNGGISDWEGNRVKHFEETYQKLIQSNNDLIQKVDADNAKIAQKISTIKKDITNLNKEISSCNNQIAAIEAENARAAAENAKNHGSNK